MPNRLKFSIEHENFDLYFQNQVKNLSREQQEILPKETVIKLFNKGGNFNSKHTNKLHFLEKLFVLWKATNKKISVAIEDEESGLNILDYLKLKTEERKKSKTEINAEGLKISCSFFLAKKELIDAFEYLNNVSISPAYNYLMKQKNTPKSKIAEYKKQTNYVWNFLWHYEARKKIMNIETRSNMPEFLVLMYLYDGKLVKSSIIHNEIFKYCYQSSRNKLKMAFRTLQTKGLITKIGNTSSTQIKITQLGIDKMNELGEKYIAKLM